MVIYINFTSWLAGCLVATTATVGALSILDQAYLGNSKAGNTRKLPEFSRILVSLFLHVLSHRLAAIRIDSQLDNKHQATAPRPWRDLTDCQGEPTAQTKDLGSSRFVGPSLPQACFQNASSCTVFHNLRTRNLCFPQDSKSFDISYSMCVWVGGPEVGCWSVSLCPSN